MTDPLGQSQVLPYLTGLSKLGYSFTLISFEKRNKYIENKNQIKQICSEAQIQWIPLSYTKRPPVLSTLWDYRKMIRKARRLHQTNPFDLVHCRSYVAALASLSLKKSVGLKFLFDMRGFWADERVDGNLWNLKNPGYKLIYKFFKSKERQFLQNADHIISLTEAGKFEMLKWGIPNLTPDKIQVIPCAADFNLFGLSSSEYREEAKLNLGFQKDDFILSYVGSIGTWYLLNEMVAFFRLLKQKCNHAKFLMLTPDNGDYIKSVLKQHSINLNDVVIKYAPRIQLPALAYASDFNIFFIKPAFSKIASSPTKLGEMLAMGIPVICNSGVGDVAQIVTETQSGFCIDDFSETTFNRVIDKMLTYKNIDREAIRNKAQRIYDLQHGIKSYLKVYNQLMPTNSREPIH